MTFLSFVCFFWVWKNCVTGMRKEERSAAGACDAAVVNNATFNKVHRDYLSLGTELRER
jgi:hypothetical protein